MPTTIAIVGRPNVGKSTLFNRLTRSKDALVDDRPGVTRDRLYAPVRWKEVLLSLIDTGGFATRDDEPLLDRVKEQVVQAVDEADIVLLMTDGRRGLMPEDRNIADLLRRTGKPVFVAVNKIDGPEHDALAMEFYELGHDRVYPVSSAHGYGVRTLMDDLVEGLPEDVDSDEEPGRIRVAVVGRPNVGKSSLINRILGLDRLLVSDIPGTTRDSVDTPFSYNNRDYTLIDTAGIRRKSRVREKIDKISMIKSLKSLDRCHVAVILIDAFNGIGEQDARICGYALERGRASVLVVNKWDLVKKDSERKESILNAMDRQLDFISFAPTIHISALTGQGMKHLFPCIESVWEPFGARIKTGDVNRTIAEILEYKPPPRSGRGVLKFYYATQAGVRPPTFVLFVNRPDLIHISYRRFLANQLRTRFGLENIPIRVYFRKRERKK